MNREPRTRVNIGDVAQIVTGSTPSSSTSDNWGDGIPFLTPSDMSQADYVVKVDRRLSKASAAKLKSRIVTAPSVAVVCIGATIGKVARIVEPTITNQQINTVVPQSNRLDPLYCFYAMQVLAPRLQNIAGGSATPILNKSRFSQGELELPPIDSQRRIAGVLGSLDELITARETIARKIAELLDAQWMRTSQSCSESRSVGELAEVVLGGTPKRAKPEYWGGSIPWLNSSKANDFRVVQASEMITLPGLESSSTKLMPRGTTIIAITGATLGQISRLEISACGNQSLVGVFSERSWVNDWLYFAIRDRVDVLVRNATGGAQQHVNKANVEELRVPMPPEASLRSWHMEAGPLLELAGTLLLHAERLRTARQELLPLLLAGHLAVKQMTA